MRKTLPLATMIMYAQLLPSTLYVQLLCSMPRAKNLSRNLLAEKAAHKMMVKLTPRGAAPPSAVFISIPSLQFFSQDFRP